MAVIGTKYAFIDGKTVGKITSVSVAWEQEQFSRLQQYRTHIIGANVNIISIGGFDDAIFNSTGTFRWVTVEVINGITALKVHEIPNVTFIPPDISATTKQDTIDYVTYNINGKSWHCAGENVYTATSEADALDKAINGWGDGN